MIKCVEAIISWVKYSDLDAGPKRLRREGAKQILEVCQSQRDCVSKPRVARNELPWVRSEKNNPNGVATSSPKPKPRWGFACLIRCPSQARWFTGPCFPLTPALSLGERENHSLLADESDTPDRSNSPHDSYKRGATTAREKADLRKTRDGCSRRKTTMRDLTRPSLFLRFTCSQSRGIPT
jgi:hypothetical protein